MRQLYTVAKFCALLLTAFTVMGNGKIVWQDGAYLRWFSNSDSGMPIGPLKEFATGFHPKAEKIADDEGVIWKCHDLSNQYNGDVANILRNRVMDDEYKTYIYIIILKIYNCEYKHNRIGTIFRDKPENLENFNLVHGAYVKLLAENGFGIEYPLPVSVLGLLPKTPVALKNPHIRKEIREICGLDKRRGYMEKWSQCMKLLK